MPATLCTVLWTWFYVHRPEYSDILNAKCVAVPEMVSTTQSIELGLPRQMVKWSVGC